MQPILFKLNRLRLNMAGTGIRKRGVGPMRPMMGLPKVYLRISGVAKDSTGTPLAGSTVSLYRTVDDKLFEEVVSDGSGNYSFSSIGLGETYYIVAYKAGVPDVAGTTVNTLVGV